MTNQTKKPAGGWKPGQSGNPAGRKPGTGEVAKIRARISARVPELLDALMVSALSGDVGAARLLLERAVAPLKAAEQPQALHMPGDTLTEKGRAVLDAVAAGELAPGQGALLLGAIGAMLKLIDADEMAARISLIEAALKIQGKQQ
jgi:hypothetical protein